MSKKYQFAIWGGGLLGRLLAWRLAKQGFRIALYDKGEINGEGSAAYVAAAMLAPWVEAIDSTNHVYQLGRQSLPLWKQWIEELSQQGWPVFFQQNGSLMVWHHEDQHLAQRLCQRLKQIHGETCWQEWNKATMMEQEPLLFRRFQQGIFLPEEAQIDNRTLLPALVQAAQQWGVDYFDGQDWNESQLKQQAEWLIDCRGIAAQKDWNTQYKSHLRGVRGEVIRVYAPEVQLQRPVRLMHPRYPLYICPKPNHIFVIGATQLESENQGKITVRSSLELLSALYSLCPAFGEAQILESLAGLRPVLNHDNPEMNYCRTSKKIAINGLFRHGFMIAPAVVQSVSIIIQDILHSSKRPDQGHQIIGEEYGN